MRPSLIFCDNEKIRNTQIKERDDYFQRRNNVKAVLPRGGCDSRAEHPYYNGGVNRISDSARSGHGPKFNILIQGDDFLVDSHHH